ncbi:MAG TPA: hypothetical protein VF970_13720 [Gemmatimonadales bacterium]
MRRLDVARLFGVVACTAPALQAQEWNGPATAVLVERAIARRAGVQSDSGLQGFEARAHGFVFFLGQLGERLITPPRLIKTDQLVVEVYWRAPGHSKQRIIGWRDRADLPTAMQYHRDHLGIVTNGFGDRIRLGEGDEVRDVPHPLSAAGRLLYDYAVVDSLTLELPQRAVQVYEVLVRPRDPGAPRVAGALYLDAGAAELVRFRFTFTRSAYLDPSLEDIAVVLDNGLWEGRYWLPRRQEIEIRRRTEWLDLPARGIIRGRWEIGDYRFETALPEAAFQGPEVVVAPLEEREAFPWPEPLASAIAGAADASMLSLAEVHAAVEQVAGARLLSALPAAQLGARSLSDVVRVNRVEGLAVGGGWVLRASDRSVEVRTLASFGTGDGRAKGTLQIRRAGERGEWRLAVLRQVRDVGDEPLASGVINSLLAQEAGLDYGDYVLRDAAEVGVRRRLGGRTTAALTLAVERTRDLDTTAQPVHGTYRSNPPLGSGRFSVARLDLERAGALAPGGSLAASGGTLSLEGGAGEGRRFVRARGTGRLALSTGGTVLVLSGWAAWGSSELPRHRAVTWGGREVVQCGGPARCGGRYGTGGTAEWRLSTGTGGPLAAAGGPITVAPFFTAGYVGGIVAGAPWVGTGGAEPFGGVAVEWLSHLVRVEVGVGLATGRAGLLVDLHRDLWPIL